MLTEIDQRIEEWVLKWKPFIQQFCFKLGLKHTEEPDWLQTARLTYWEVIDRFEEGKGASLDSFVLKMVKLRLIDLKKAERNQNRFWLNDSLSLDDVDVWANTPRYQVLQLDVSSDSETVLRLIYHGYSIRELRRKLGIPSSVINKAKDEITKSIIKGGNLMMRPILEERARELGLSITENEDDLALASRILSHGSTAKRRFRIVSVSDTDPENKEKICTNGKCDHPAVEGSKFCSLLCAEKALRDYKISKRQPRQQFATKPDMNGAFGGTESEEGIKALINPFKDFSAAFEIFELFRIGGTRQVVREKFEEIALLKAIRCTSPDERVRRVVTDTRKLGFELAKTKGGFFRLTGRMK